MAKISDNSSSGTSFHNVTVLTTANELERVYGAPTLENVDGKTNWDWCLETNDGQTTFTVYDWYEGRNVDKDSLIDFHIGAYNFMDSMKAQEEVQQDLEK
jgi:hypothetical protein